MARTTLSIRDGVAWITLDDGKVNAMSSNMLAEIAAHLETAEEASTVTVIRGREGIFSAGFDMPTLAGGREAAIAMVREGAHLVQRLLAHPHPVVTACTGHAYPMGAVLMLAADCRFGVEGPYRIGMNETAIGLTVPKFALALAHARLTRPGFLRVATATLFSPEEARDAGYLDHVVAARDLDSMVRAEAARLLSLDQPSFAATKARMNQAAIDAIAAAIEEELAEAA
jgi:enoyl-CoA hydratase